MDNLRNTFSLIAQFSGKENVIAVNSAFARYVGKDLAIGAFLSQCVYWSDKTSRKDGFFYKSNAEWQEELFITDYTVRKAISKLKEMGILETKRIKANGAPTLHYRINMENFITDFMNFLSEEKKHMEKEEAETVENSGFVDFNESIRRFQQKETLISTKGNVDFNESITENTTKTTKKITTKKKDIAGQSPAVSIPFFEIINHLNKQTDSKYRAEGAKNRSLIKARWNEGYRLEDFKHVIDVKTEEWINTDMEKHLCPETLFSNKFEKYVNQKIKKKAATKTTNSADYNMEDYY